MKHLIITMIALLCMNTSNAQGWKPNPKYVHKSDTTKVSKGDKIQCSGTTTKGERCKRMGYANPDLRKNTFLCWQHINQQ